MQARTLILDDDCGHNAIHCEPEKVAGAIHDLLDNDVSIHNVPVGGQRL
jgi:hypothetical protein